MKGGVMNNTKQSIPNIIRTFVLCGLALGWLLVVAHSQESGKRGAKTNEPAAPEILSVRPIGMNGEPHLQPGKQVILLGRNFSPPQVSFLPNHTSRRRNRHAQHAATEPVRSQCADRLR